MSKSKPLQKWGSASSFEETPTHKDIDKMNIKYENPSVAGQFKDFLKTVVTFTGDLSSLTCPAFFLNGQSLLEYRYEKRHPSGLITQCYNNDGILNTRSICLRAVPTGVTIRRFLPPLAELPTQQVCTPAVFIFLNSRLALLFYSPTIF